MKLKKRPDMSHEFLSFFINLDYYPLSNVA